MRSAVIHKVKVRKDIVIQWIENTLFVFCFDVDQSPVIKSQVQTRRRSSAT